MAPDLSTPVWAIEQHRERWRQIDLAIRAAFDFYTDRFLPLRHAYPWKHHVAAFQYEVAYQVKESFADLHDQQEVEFLDRDGLFLLQLEDGVLVKFAAIHKGGRPNLNRTGQASGAICQHLLFKKTAEGAEKIIVAGYIMDPAWETVPEASVSFYSENARVWRFLTSDAEMDRTLQLYRRAD